MDIVDNIETSSTNAVARQINAKKNRRGGTPSVVRDFGLLADGPPGSPELPFILPSDTSQASRELSPQKSVSHRSSLIITALAAIASE
jgi:hypothetical protein